MHPDAFAATREPAWEELARLTAAARGRVRRLPAGDILRLGARYREAAADLAYARRRYGDDPVTRRLETLVLRSRPLVYGAPTRRGSLLAYLAHGYWRAVAERPKPLIAAWLLLLVPAVLAALWALGDPSAAGGLVPAEMPQRGRAAAPGPRAARRRRARGRLDRDLRQQHPGHVHRLRGRHHARAPDGLRAGHERDHARRPDRSRGGRGQRRRPAAAGRRPRRARALVHRRRRRRGPARRLVDRRARGRSRASSRCAPRPGARSGSCSARCRGSCSPGSSRAS